MHPLLEKLQNFVNSAMVFSKHTRRSVNDEIFSILEVQEVSRHQRYLRLSTFIGDNKCHLFRSIKERVWKRMQGWDEKLLSRAGKDALIKPVAQSIPCYIISLFKLPKKYAKNLPLFSLVIKTWEL